MKQKTMITMRKVKQSSNHSSVHPSYLSIHHPTLTDPIHRLNLYLVIQLTIYPTIHSGNIY